MHDYGAKVFVLLRANCCTNCYCNFNPCGIFEKMTLGYGVRGPGVLGPGVWKIQGVENTGSGAKHGVWWKSRGLSGKHGV